MIHSGFARTDRRWFAVWWWQIDRLSLSAIGFLAVLGLMFLGGASPPVAELRDMDPMAMVWRQMMLLPFAAGLLILCSFMSPIGIFRMGFGLMVIAIIGLIIVALDGDTTKGAQRWVSLGGVRLQPSEFAKPALAVMTAWFLHRSNFVTGSLRAIGLTALVLSFLFLQPDIGMTMLVTVVAGIQLLVAGAPMLLVVVGLGAMAVLAFSAYHMFDHVQSRMDHFVNVLSGDLAIRELPYQEKWAQTAINDGGIFGLGPGNGVAKEYLPDTHSDFIFAAGAEEFGLIICGIVVAIYAVVVLRGLLRLEMFESRFRIIASTGLIAHFGLQALINIGVNLGLLPTKGMTLPFISYGGSSLMATAITLGMIFALTRFCDRSDP